MRRYGYWLPFALAACSDQGVAPDAAPDAASDATVGTPSPLVEALAGKRVLWIGAHPDDESTVAPLLGEVCRDRGATCTFLLATRGENGDCNAPVVCGADLGAFRAGEMATAAALYGGSVVQLGLPDGSALRADEVAANWAALRGGPEALVEQFRAAIVAAAPEFIITFDPRHGTTCHPDHRAAAAYAVSAVLKLGASAPTTWLAEVTFAIQPNESAIGYLQTVAADTKVLTYDATRLLRTTGMTAWDVLLANLRAHKSQFVDARIAGFAAAPAEQRRVFILPLADVADPDPRYVLCD